MSDNIIELNGNKIAPNKPKPQRHTWEIVTTESEIVTIEGYLILNGMVVAVMDEPENPDSVLFYCPVDTVQYVMRKKA